MHVSYNWRVDSLRLLRLFVFFFSSRRRHTRLTCDWSSDVCSSDLASLQSRRHAPRPADRLRLAHRFRADQHPPVHPAGGPARGHGVSEASRRAAVPRQLRRIPPHDPPRAGARLPAEPRLTDVRALPALPPSRHAVVVDRGPGRILFRRRGLPRRDGTAGHDDRRPSPHARGPGVRIRGTGVSGGRQHPSVPGRAVRGMAHSRAVQRHLEVQRLRRGAAWRLRSHDRATVRGMAILDAPAILPGGLQPATARDHGTQTHRARDQAHGLSVSGYSDLYRLWLAGPADSLGAGRLERLTSDRYEDLDPTVSPDGGTVVFSSDRTPFGTTGAHNLFALDLGSGAIRYLTYGDWRDEAPRWGAGRIYFASDRDGTFQVYSIDSAGPGRRETRSLTC